MAPFRLGYDELQHELPWLLMLNGPVTKYWRHEYFEEDVEDLQRRGFVVQRFDCARWRDAAMMFDDLKAGLGLPAYTGSGFDALADSLTDIDVPEPTGMMVALDNFNSLEEGDMLLHVLGAASRWWLLFGRLFAVLIRTDDPVYGGPIVRGVPVNWNGREWLNADPPVVPSLVRATRVGMSS